MNQQSASHASPASQPARATAAIDTPLTRDQIVARLNVLGEAARARMCLSDPAILGAVGGAEIDFMTLDERAERHRLCLMLPTQKEEADAARARIQARIKNRNSRRANEETPGPGMRVGC